MSEYEELPTTVAVAWGLRDAASRPRRRGLSLARIVEAGIRVATAEGLPAVSMNRVAAELGAAPMSLYRHLAAKDELLAHMVDSVYQLAPTPPDAGESWRDGLRRWAAGYLTILRRHPWVLRIPIGGPPLMPNQVLWLERGLQCLQNTRLAADEKPSTLLLIDGFVRSQATLEADLQVAARTSGTPLEQVGTAYGRTLARLTDAARFPAIHALLEARVFDGEAPLDHDFTFGLGRILDGIDVLVRAREQGGAAT